MKASKRLLELEAKLTNLKLRVKTAPISGTSQMLQTPTPNEQKLNRLSLLINREKYKMKQQSRSARKARTRTLIQVGGLVQKSGLMTAFGIEPGDDLQDYEHIHKARQLLGLLDEINPNGDRYYWEMKGQSLLAEG